MKIQVKYLAAAGLLILGAVTWHMFARYSAAGPQGAQAQPEAVPVIAGKVTMHDVPLYESGLGTVQAYNTVNVQVRVDGQLESVDFQEGQDVTEGQRLALIDPRPFQAALDNALANLARDQATLANSKRDLARYQDTAAKGYSSRQQLDTQAASVGALEATLQADQALIETAQVQLGYATITAPIGGRTGIRRVDKGNIVHAADTGGLVVITQLKPISVIFTLPQDALPAIAAAQKGGPLSVTALSRTDSVEVAQGVLELVDNQIDPATGTIRLKARFPNDDLALWPGAFVNARLEIGIAHNGLTIDSRVVQRGPKGAIAYVVKADDTVEIRPIGIGQDDRGQTLVTRGLKAGERVVIDGQLRLDNGVKVSAKPVDAPRQTGYLETPTP